MCKCDKNCNSWDDFPGIEWAKEMELNINVNDLKVDIAVLQDEIDPITGEKKPYECEGCSA